MGSIYRTLCAVSELAAYAPISVSCPRLTNLRLLNAQITGLFPALR